MMSRRDVVAGLGALPIAAHAAATAAAKTVGAIERKQPEMDRVIAPDAAIEVLGTGYQWAEGPLWVPAGGYLLFTDVPGNTIHRWRVGEGVSVYRRPSGLEGVVPDSIREAGANGLALDNEGRLVYADSGNRAVQRIDLTTGKRTTLVERFEGKRFNSPNDLIVARSGAIYFSDPPYGLAGVDDSPLRELDFKGLYRLAPDGQLDVLDRSIPLPNGVALSPDQRTLYLAMSDKDRPEILAYTLDDRGFPVSQRRFADMRGFTGPGLPDGLKTDRAGRVFATGPGGVHVFTPQGELLGTVSTGKSIANCAIGDGGRWLFLTSSDMIARIALVADA